MSTKLPTFVTEYFELQDKHPDEFCVEQKQLRQRITRVFATEDLIVHEDRFDIYIRLGGNLGFAPGYEWQRFLLGLMLCTYKKDSRFKSGESPRWRWMICFMGRGNGKDIVISWFSYCLISPYNPIKEYDIDIFAHVETQAMRPVIDITDALSREKTKYKRHFHWTKEGVKGLANGGVIIGHANNPKAGEGLRSGAIVFNEAHTYTDVSQLDVGKNGLGKVDEPRQLIFTTDGDVVDGPLDSILEDGHELLNNPEMDDEGKLYFLCKLDSKEEVHDKKNWHKANPSLRYQPSLMDETEDAYKEWVKSPSKHPGFMTKRMNIRQSLDVSVITTPENIQATRQEIPFDKLRGKTCVAGIDFSKTTDWTSVNLHFRWGDKRIDISHSWVCLQSQTLWKVKAPFRDWSEVTLVDEPEISPKLIADYLRQMMRQYRITAVCLDSFRYELMKDELAKIGFSQKYKNLKMYRPSDIMKVYPVIDRYFVNHLFIWGDTPSLRWAANNTAGKPAKKSNLAAGGEIDMGNFLYEKIEGQSRKTDPFMALVASVIIEDQCNDCLAVRRSGRRII